MFIGKYIDHTILKPAATKTQVQQIIDEAIQYDFASVCINPYWVSLASKALAATDVNVCTVIGFPLGATTTSSKVAETIEACLNGASEVDMVINIGELKEHHDEAVYIDIAAVATAAHNNGAILKVIIECALLTESEKVRACQLAEKGKADYVKTSTGFAKSGATVADVKLMRTTVGDRLGVKAAGGIHTADDAIALIDAGASRLGCSASVTIMQEMKLR